MQIRVNHCGIVILAAGQSSRLGSPKQLLPYKDSTLLRHAAQVALEANIGPVLVVTGAHHEAVANAIEGLPISAAFNPDWQEGMASSLRVGLQAMVEAFPETDGILFMVCDQPYVSTSLLCSLVETQHKTGKAIVASTYQGNTGTPALFHHSFFNKLLELKGDKGARLLLETYAGEVVTILFKEGVIDIDWKADWERLVRG